MMEENTKNMKRPRINELLTEEAERVGRITEEFERGFEFLRNYEKAATIFGSARSESKEEYYQKARKLAQLLAKDGFAVITGGGPGIMEAANLGAVEAGGRSVGINIELDGQHPTERRNKHVKEGESFHYFFSRKVMLAFASEVYFYLPGGFGTLDEFFEILTLVQTGKMSPVPIILVHRDFWEPFLDFIDKTLRDKYATVNSENTSLYHLVDTPQEAFDLAKELMKEYGLE
ncbi:MAG: TIGR00730 family Rossman fold protein [Candidatus Spechtbacterales bacterium]